MMKALEKFLMGHREWWGASAPGVVGQLGLGKTLTMSITCTMFFCSLLEKRCVNECRLKWQRRRWGLAAQYGLSLVTPVPGVDIGQEAAVELSVQEVASVRVVGSFQLRILRVQLIGLQRRRVSQPQVATGLSARAALGRVTASVVPA